MTTYIINGIGKCGTTLVYQYLCTKYVNGGFICNLNNIRFSVSDIVYKTHSPFPAIKYKDTAKVLFMFGDVMNTVVAFANSWGKNKKNDFPHQGAIKNMFIDLDCVGKSPYECNTFNFMRSFNNWCRPHKYPVMLVRYEKMYDNLKSILSFCGIKDNDFPKFKERKTNWKTMCSSEQKDRLFKIYGEAYKFEKTFPDIKII